MATFEVKLRTKDRLEAVASLPWVARLPKKTARKVSNDYQDGEVQVYRCEEYCYGRMPLYARYAMSRKDYRILGQLEKGRTVDELHPADRAYWQEREAKSEAARERGRCKLNAGWVYIDVFGEIHRVCTHHLDNHLTSKEGTRNTQWWTEHARRLEIS